MNNLIIRFATYDDFCEWVWLQNASEEDLYRNGVLSYCIALDRMIQATPMKLLEYYSCLMRINETINYLHWLKSKEDIYAVDELPF